MVLPYAFPSWYRPIPGNAAPRDSEEWTDPVCLAWATILAFLRIITNPRAFEHPLSMEEGNSDRFPMVGL